MSGRISFMSGMVALSAAALGSLWLTPVTHPLLKYDQHKRGAAKLCKLEDTVNHKVMSALLAAFGGKKPEGEFLKGRHGVTHFVLRGNNLDKLIVMAHGLGTNHYLYDKFVKPMLAQGFSVLTYDYFNHGFSVATDMFLQQDSSVLVEQLEDLLDHVLPSKDTPLFGLVGHSTGGIVGIVADAEMSRPIKNMLFVSPAIFIGDKPLVAQICEKGAYVYLENGFLRRNMLHFMVKDAYLENDVIAWARDPKTSQYIFGGIREAHKKLNSRMFMHHPFINGGIWGVNIYTLRMDLLAGYVKSATKSETRTLVLWGKLDMVVPYTQANVNVLSSNPAVTVKGLAGLGHESLFENPSAILTEMLDFFQNQ